VVADEAEAIEMLGDALRDAVDLYVDGMRFATGRLLVAEDGSLQLAIDEVFGLQNGAPPADQQETSNDSPTQSREV
jgi:flagellar motor switch protein FliN/FliY